MRYSVSRFGRAFEVLEEGDHLARVATPDDVRDLVYARAHRRAFELASLSGWVRLRGALVDLAGRRVLIAGPSGVGKTTLALRMLFDGDAVQGDESVLVRAGTVVAVPQPLYIHTGTERFIPELTRLLPALARVADSAVLDPGRGRFPWHLRYAPLDHIVLLDSTRREPDCVAVAQTAAVAALVPEVLRATETKSVLLRELTAAVSRARCHRIGVADPTAMRAAILNEISPS